MPVATGGAMIQRTPNGPAWYRGGLWHDNMPLNVPGLWFMSWYDVSVGPNIAMYNHVRETADSDVADQQWVVIAPTTHCGFRRTGHRRRWCSTRPGRVHRGERNLGDVRFNYQEIMFEFFDRFLKGKGGDVLDTLPKVHYFTMGSNEWQSSNTWPPEGAEQTTLYLSSGGKANTMAGDGVLTTSPPRTDRPDAFTYDPMDPVMSYGGNGVLSGQRHDRRRVRPARDGKSEGYPRVHVRAVRRGHRDLRADRANAVRLLGRQGHRFHREGDRRVSRRPRLQPRRIHSAHAATATGTTGRRCGWSRGRCTK